MRGGGGGGGGGGLGVGEWPFKGLKPFAHYVFRYNLVSVMVYRI